MAQKQSLADWALSATPEQLQRGDWRIVCAGLRTAKERFSDAGLGNQSWLDCYIQIAESRGKDPEDCAALATQPQAPQGAVTPLTPEQIDKAYRDVWSTVPHAHRLTAFAHAIYALAAPETPEGAKP